MREIMLWAVLICLFTLPQLSAAQPPSASLRPVVTEILADAPPSERSVPGVITARTEVILGFQTLGRVVSRLVEVGDTVVEGQQLAAIDPDDLQGNVTAADAAVQAALVQLNTTQATTERTRQLAQRNVVSTARLEQAENALASAEAAYVQAQSELISAHDAEGFANLLAPFDGVISEVMINAGAVVSAGQPVLRLSAADELEAVIDLPQSALANMKSGQPYQVWSESDKDHPLPASLRMIGPIADAATRTRRVHLSLAQDQGLRLGALIRAHPTPTGQKTLTIPLSAIRQQDGQPHVWVVQTKGIARFVQLRPILTTGPVIGQRITLLSGLNEGDEIITRGVNSLTEGQPVGPGIAP